MAGSWRAAGLWVFCGRISAALRPLVVSRALCSGGTAGSSGLTQCNFHKTAEKVNALHHCRLLHTSGPLKGLEEFFDDPKNWGESTVKSGAPWTIQQLRAKSSEDLHKLWYVLLKEKNMLLTLEQESKRQRLAMPSPERMEKVDQSMSRLDDVIQEREVALRLLQTGQEKDRPGDWRRNCFGQTFWYKFHEWSVPWYVNRNHRSKQFFALPYVNRYLRLRLEKHLRKRARQQTLEAQKQRDLKRRFPHLAERSQP
ncbi:large ribosomal subunit protein uL29m [Microcaecilia unicolor]|uniref:Large ribosomal subunit protein uL29m n=1 Tax=Microcaecilia unicolor TaxID=1415580 RepID=A0A6P7YYF2_9AMPH|nr:39S ribosomal protein L47, mitochondrial [Microcaecilia unicolor]